MSPPCPQLGRAQKLRGHNDLNGNGSTLEKVPQQIAHSAATDMCKSLHIAAAAPPKHVLFVIDQLVEYGGAERVLVNTIRWLPKDKFRCTLLTFKLAPDFAGLKDLDCPLEVWTLKKTYDLRAARTAMRLRKFIRKENVALVHTFFETSDLWAAPIAKLGTGVRVISSRRDMGILRSGKHSMAYRFAGRFYDRVVAVSEQVRQFCISTDGLPKAKVTTLYNGIDTSALSSTQASRRLARDGKVPVITTVAHIRKVKGIDVLVDVADAVRQKYPEVQFRVVGAAHEPDYFQVVQQTVARRGLESTVQFVGESHNAAEFLADSDIFFLPSRSEGFSNAIVEAMLCELPSVVTNVGGNAEAIEDGNTGFVVPSDDAEKAARRICTLLADQNMQRKMGTRARQSALDRFTAGAMIDGLTKIYDEVLHA